MTNENQEILLNRAYHWESTTPEKVYLTQPTGGGEVRDYTWKQAMDEARRMAAHLLGLKLEPGTKIALLGKNSAHWILSDLAIMMAGHVSVPLYPTLTADNARQILEHSESKLVFVGKLDEWEDLKNGIPKDMPIIELPLAPNTGAPKWEQIVAETEPLQENVTRDPGELATIIYTSGTTGTPKGVMSNFRSMIDAAKGTTERAEIGTNDRLISYLPLAHCYERMVIESGSLLTGVHVFFAESLDTFVADLQRARPTLFCSVPRLWVKFQAGVFAKVPKDKLERLLSIPIVSWLVRRKILKGLGLDQTRMAASAAAPLPQEVLHWYHSLGLELLEGYGMTENFAYSHANPVGDIRVGTVGLSSQGVETKISEEGEVLVKSPGTMMGYYKAPDMTAEVLTEDGYLRTGDLGKIDADGFLTITGRVKELFKTSKGKYISPATIENLLMNHHMVEQACVCGLGFDQPFALIMPSEEVRRDVADGSGKERIAGELEKLIEQVNAQVEHHERLQYLAIARDEWGMDNGFITPTMKIKRAALEEHYGPHFQPWFDTGHRIIWENA